MRSFCAHFAACALLSGGLVMEAYGDHGELRADSHAPIGVMGDHTHKQGELMVSYRYMTMSMGGSRDGTDSLSPEEIVTTVPNRFFGAPGQPPTLRVVPIDMTMDMHMFGLMYAPADWLTIMGMTQYVEKEMDHVTFQGGVGETRLGRFTTRSEGLGDSSISGLISLKDSLNQKMHVTVGLSFPTGSTTRSDVILTPTGQSPNVRLPYPMQLGSGTVDVLAGLTYARYGTHWAGGVQWSSTVRTGTNDEGYSLGDKHQISAWTSYLWKPSLSGSLRLSLQDRGSIDGIDPQIVAPVQTADPDRQGGMSVDLGVGLNYATRRGHRLAFELRVPFYQDLDGPQLETDWLGLLGYQYAF